MTRELFIELAKFLELVVADAIERDLEELVAGRQHLEKLLLGEVFDLEQHSDDGLGAQVKLLRQFFCACEAYNTIFLQLLERVLTMLLQHLAQLLQVVIVLH